MKAILEFNLPEEQSEHSLAINGCKYYSCLFKLEQMMRSIVKYGHEYKDIETLADEIRDIIRESLGDE